MTLHTKDSATFQQVKDSTRPSQFAGLPLSVEQGAKYITYDWNFVHEWDRPGSTTGGWTVTVVGTTPTATLSDDLIPPRLIITNTAVDNDQLEAQYTSTDGAGEFLKLRANKKLYFRCAFAFADANGNAATIQESDLFIGLAISDTTVIAGVTDYIGFFKPDGSLALRFVAGKNSTTLGDQHTTTIKTFVAADASVTTPAESKLTTCEFLAIGTNRVLVWVNNALVANVTSSTQFPDDEELCVTACFQNGEAVQKLLHIGQLYVAQER